MNRAQRRAAARGKRLPLYRLTTPDGRDLTYDPAAWAREAEASGLDAEALAVMRAYARLAYGGET